MFADQSAVSSVKRSAVLGLRKQRNTSFFFLYLITDCSTCISFDLLRCDIRVIQAQKGATEKSSRQHSAELCNIFFFFFIAGRIFNQSEFNMMGESKDWIKAAQKCEKNQSIVYAIVFPF